MHILPSYTYSQIEEIISQLGLTIRMHHQDPLRLHRTSGVFVHRFTSKRGLISHINGVIGSQSK